MLKDLTVSKVDDQYLIGDRMMVAPMFAGEKSRTVVIPSGEDWHDFWTGNRIAGGSSIQVSASEEKIPVYVKTGSVIPWADAGPHEGSPESRRLSARIYGDGSRSFEMDQSSQRLRLVWTAGNTAPLQMAGYSIYEWKRIGS